jgi:cytidyltransferase-like protein
MGLLQFFLKKEYRDSMVLLNDQDGSFLGTVTYKSVLSNENYDDCIQKNKVVIDQNIFLQARKCLEVQPEVPVFNKQGDLVYFCYDDKRGMFDTWYENILEYFDNNDGLFIENVYDTIQAVHFYDLNEWAYRIYKILNKRNVVTYVTGQKWEEIFQIDQSTSIDYPEYNVMSIYSEGSPYFKNKGKSPISPCTIFYFIEKIAMANQLYIAQSFKNSLMNQMFICRFPEFYELSYFTPNESLRNSKVIHTGIENINTKNYVINTAFENAAEMPYEEFVQQRRRDAVEAPKVYFNIDGNNVQGLLWGHGKYRIYLMGPCIVAIHCTLKEGTLMAYLQQYLEALKPSYEIVAIPIFFMEMMSFEKVLKSLPINKKDIIIYFDCVGPEIMSNPLFSDSTDIELLPLFNNREHNNNEWFFDVPVHTTKHANKKIAEELSQFITNKVRDFHSNETISEDILSSEEVPDELKNYLDLISSEKPNNPSLKIGCIVMNCNPFTLGHQYLINTARNQVDLLYIFVVEEDKSFFKFDDRFQLVKECCRDYDNVKVLPSGKYILSYETFPLYFEKATQQEAVIDASVDLDLFARYIAPALNITTRFVGEEPTDLITRQYNSEMIKNLPSYGINVVVIPRIEVGNVPISASKVRQLLKQHAYDEMKKLLPEATYQFLIKKYQ